MVSSVTGAADRTVVYTDGACRGNPGPGGWGWVVPDGPWANGFDPDTTNQRMELMAVLDALRTIEGPVEVVSDSTYVVNCFRDGWWKGWLKRGWKNSKKEPVANRDIWEPLIDLYRSREEEITFTWVKGHAGDEYNDIADRLAVEASHTGRGRHGVGTPDDLGPLTRSTQADPFRRLRHSRARRRVLVLVGADRSGNPHHGVQPPQLGGYDPNPIADEVRRQITEILVAKAELHPDLVVVTGLRLGAETLAAEAAAEAELPFVAVLPFPDPEIKWPAARNAAFTNCSPKPGDRAARKEGAGRQPGGRPGAGPPQRLAAQDRHGSDRRVGPRRTADRKGRAGARTGAARRCVDRQPLSMRCSAGSNSGSVNS